MSSSHSPLSHLQLIPAEKVSAFYDNDAKTLNLKASGVHVDITKDIRFHRLPLPGGLLFELQGWVGPIIRGSSPYSITDVFNIDLPSKTYPIMEVLVNTANEKGLTVPIEILLKNGPQETQLTSKGNTPSELPEVKDVAGNQEIITDLGTTFTIQQSDSFKGQGGTVNIAFDKNFVALTNAGIEEGKIQWTFTSMQVGATGVTVYVGQTNPPFVYRVVHVVSIVPPNDPKAPEAIAYFSLNPANSNGNHTKNDTKNVQAAGPIGIPISWDGFVNIGFNLIKKEYPDAQLYEIDATPATKEPVFNEWGLVNNRIVCRLDGNKTAIIQSNGWGSFGSVQTIDAPFLGDVVLKWPVSMVIHDAFSILRKAGYEQAVSAVTLRQPLNPTDDQPFYIFNIGNEFIAVGVNDKKVYNFGATGRREVQQS